MIFPIGAKVVLINTGEVGLVKGYDEHMVLVLLEGDYEIPVFVEDIRLIDELAENIADTSEEDENCQIPFNDDFLVQLLASGNQGVGLYLVFYTDMNSGSQEYSVTLVNCTAKDMVYQIKVFEKGIQKLDLGGLVKQAETVELKKMSFDQLNNSPSFEIEAAEMSTLGTGNWQQKQLKIRPKTFFKIRKVSEDQQIAYHPFQIFDQVRAFQDNDEDSESIQEYYERNSKVEVKSEDIIESANSVKSLDLDKVVNFTNEIDLHIENYLLDPSKFSNAEILQYQLDKMKAFVEEALVVGVEKVFIVHGLGKGKLKKAVFNYLKEHPHVKDYKNELHPKFGYGATEVTL